MKRRIVGTQAFLIGFAFTVAASFTHVAGAWTRTVPSTAFVAPGAPSIKMLFPSDGTSGTPNGSSTTGVWVDFYIVGTGTANVSARACGFAYNHSGGGCGAISTGDYGAGEYDVALQKWSGTGSMWTTSTSGFKPIR